MAEMCRFESALMMKFDDREAKGSMWTEKCALKGGSGCNAWSVMRRETVIRQDNWKNHLSSPKSGHEGSRKSSRGQMRQHETWGCKQPTRQSVKPILPHLNITLQIWGHPESNRNEWALNLPFNNSHDISFLQFLSYAFLKFISYYSYTYAQSQTLFIYY